MSHRIGVMRNGEMTVILENDHIQEEELIKYFIGANKKAGGNVS
jgi:ABC-type sugar transport system ATPase subunit